MTCFDKRNCTFSNFHTVCCFLFSVVLYIVLGCFFTDGGKKLEKINQFFTMTESKRKTLLHLLSLALNIRKYFI